jgi:hypothetical protein
VTELFTVADLTDEERHVLARGLLEWGGPAHASDALAVAMDFGSAAAMLEDADRLSHRPVNAIGAPVGRRGVPEQSRA